MTSMLLGEYNFRRELKPRRRFWILPSITKWSISDVKLNLLDKQQYEYLYECQYSQQTK